MFDFLGTFARRQWEEPVDGFRKFLLDALNDLNARLNYLQLETVRVERYIAKLMDADGALGGTAHRGNQAGLFGRTDIAQQALSDPKRQVPTLKFLASASAREALGRIGVVSDGTMSGGDHIWIDLPLRNELIEPGRIFTDQVTGALMEQAKAGLFEVIRRRRETLEFKLKKAWDYREQLLREFFDLSRKKVETVTTLDEARQSDTLQAILPQKTLESARRESARSVNKVVEAIDSLIERNKLKVRQIRMKTGLDPGTEDIPQTHRDGLVKESAGETKGGVGQKGAALAAQTKTTAVGDGQGKKGTVVETGLESQVEESSFVTRIEDTGGLVQSSKPTRSFPIEQTDVETRDRFEFKFDPKQIAEKGKTS